MTPEQAIQQAQNGALRPIYLVLGEEDYLRGEVVKALREASLAEGVAGLNDDQFVAGESDVQMVLSVAKTVPMLARRRTVLVRSIERWEPTSGKKSEDALDRLAAYAQAAIPETTLILSGGKLDKRRRLVALAKKEGWLVSCEPLGRQDLPRWIEQHARSLGGELRPGVAGLVAELTGPELAPVADAVNRLVLYAGSEAVTEDHVAECLVKLRSSTVWELVDAVASRDLARALAVLSEVFEPREAPRLVGLLAWSTRQLIRFEAEFAEGGNPAEAARKAGAPPFRARELEAQVKRTSRARLERWLSTLADVDLAVKGGSKRSAKAVFEQAIIETCRSGGARLARGGGGP